MPLIQILLALRRGRPPVVGEPLYPDGRQHQVDLECRGGNRRGVVAPEHFWAISLPRAHPHRDIASGDRRLSRGCDSRNRTNDRPDVSCQIRKMTRGRYAVMEDHHETN
jgi:hypothetical protein